MTYYINTVSGLRQMSDRIKRPPIGAWFTTGPGHWCQLRVTHIRGVKNFEWVDVPKDQLPKTLRTRALLLGLPV